MADELTPEQKADGGVITEARKRHSRCVSRESDARARYRTDIRFANADPDNHWQWPDNVWQDRAGANNGRPCLTINKTRIHNLQIKNDARQNKPSIKIRPTGGGATFKSSEVFESVVRHIEYKSNAQVAYDWAVSTQVDGGIGYWRVATEYANNDSDDQEIFIRRVKDPLTVWMDPDISELDGSDAKFCFIADDMDRDDFNEAYPEWKDKVGSNPAVLTDNTDWVTQDKIRVAEYFRRVQVKDHLVRYDDGGERKTIRKSEIPKELRKKFLDEVIDAPTTKVREILDHKVEWFLIAGDHIIERADWVGTTIPIVRIVGEETFIDGQIDRKGHTRNLKDAQRMFNYNASASVEFGALQTKVPWVGPARAFEGFETLWDAANKKNFAWLPYNDYDDDGQRDIDKPERPQPPGASPVFEMGMQNAQLQMMMASGQYQAQMGENENAKSGKAIGERQRQGDNATYHFIDNLAIGIRRTGKILIEIIPKVYDTQRIIKIMAQDGTEQDINIDPDATMALLEEKKEQTDEVRKIFNPSVGEYEVQADIGPAYGTQRQEAWNAFVQIATMSPELFNKIGDLMFRNADFMNANEIAERLKRDIEENAPYLLGKGPGPTAAKLGEQVQHLSKIVETLQTKLAEERSKSRAREEKQDISAYDAETRRMGTLAKMPGSPQELQALIHQVVADALSTRITQIQDANAPDLGIAAEEYDAAPEPA